MVSMDGESQGAAAQLVVEFRLRRGRRSVMLPNLFERDLPSGFHYRENFITDAEEQSLSEAIADVTFSDFEMRGVVARRRVAFFGEAYDRAVAGPLPAFLLPLRSMIARWADVDDARFAMALINEYRPGTPIGWHRDAPQYDIVAGVSLLSAGRMKFRPYRPPSSTGSSSGRRSATHEIELARRSAYLMTHDSRSAYEHHIPPVASLRYSITFRTLR
jgi:alkylated DNA repair dioxygenase AlkB